MFKAILRRAQRMPALLGWALFTLAATVMGPFNTLATMEDGRRLVYWGVIVGGALLLSAGLARLIARFEPDSSCWRADGMRIGGMVLGLSPMIYGWTQIMVRGHGTHAPSLLRITLLVALIGTVVQVSKRIVRGQPPLGLDEGGAVPDPLAMGPHVDGPDPDPDPAPAPEPDPDPAPRLMRRLPEGVEGPVLRLSASDHFVEVVLPGDTHSLRMRFTDAIDEMDGIEGYCSHRSHWVARDAILGVERDGARIQLRLQNGDLVPVSRTFRPDLEEAGIV